MPLWNVTQLELAWQARVAPKYKQVSGGEVEGGVGTLSDLYFARKTNYIKFSLTGSGWSKQYWTMKSLEMMWKRVILMLMLYGCKVCLNAVEEIVLWLKWSLNLSRDDRRGAAREIGRYGWWRGVFKCCKEATEAVITCACACPRWDPDKKKTLLKLTFIKHLKEKKIPHQTLFPSSPPSVITFDLRLRRYNQSSWL